MRQVTFNSMSDLVRNEVANSARCIVIKVGTRVLTHPDGRLNTDRVAQLAEQLNGLIESGRRVVLVSSGAVGAGLSHLGWSQRPADIAKLQAVAAIGQAKLIEEYDRHLGRHGRHAAQVLLTADDLNHRNRYLNIRNTLVSLLDLGVLPIINENDTVAVEELMATFGDNDQLAAVVTNLLQASLLIILSDIDGLYDGNPSDPDSRLVSLVENMDQDMQTWVVDKKTGLSKGGMRSKLNAARMVTHSGENVIIANGHQPGVLSAIFQGETVGTLFLGQGRLVASRKRWIGFSAQPQGSVAIDDGAAKALIADGRSLLPIGITSHSGDFQKGDVIAVVNQAGEELARGLINYESSELARIVGQNSSRISEILGHHPYDEAIHRDNLMLTERFAKSAHDSRADLT